MSSFKSVQEAWTECNKTLVRLREKKLERASGEMC